MTVCDYLYIHRMSSLSQRSPLRIQQWNAAHGAKDIGDVAELLCIWTTALCNLAKAFMLHRPPEQSICSNTFWQQAFSAPVAGFGGRLPWLGEPTPLCCQGSWLTCLLEPFWLLLYLLQMAAAQRDTGHLVCLILATAEPLIRCGQCCN